MQNEGRLRLRNHPSLSTTYSVSTGMTFTAVIHKEGQWYVAECPEAGTTSQGNTIEEALENLQKSTEVYLEEFPLEEGPRPILTTFEVAIKENSRLRTV